MRKRSQAREIALQTVYQLELKGNTFDNGARDFIKFQAQDPAIITFVEDLLQGYFSQQTQLDQSIKKVALNWSISRMAVIDRIILRLATYELMFRPDIPPVVAINEAVDLAKKYGAKDSGAFVNGILDKIHQSRRQ